MTPRATLIQHLAALARAAPAVTLSEIDAARLALAAVR